MLIAKPLRTETPKAFRVFKYWIDLGPDRSHQKVADRFKCSLGNVDRWACKHDWQPRLSVMLAEEAEREGEAATRAAQKAAHEREKLRLKHEKTMAKHLVGVSTIIAKMLRMPVGPENFNWGQLARLLDQYDRSNRLLLGLPTGRAELTGIDGEPLKLPQQAQITNIIVQRDGQSDKVSKIYYDYFRSHPEHPQAQRFIKEFQELQEGNGSAED